MSLAKSDTYLRSVEATVLSCVDAADDLPRAACGEALDRLKSMEKRFNITLDKTVFYPIGGGQPSDTGMIGGARCEFVEEIEDGSCVHWCDGPLDVGKSVLVTIDWDRRWHNAQHHTAQHILSALAFDQFGADTLSWELNSESCEVEFPASTRPSEESMRKLEDSVNQTIRSLTGITIRYVCGDNSDGELDSFAANPLARGCVPTRGQYKVVRFVDIEGIDINGCGGTHLKNTGEIQAWRIIGAATRKDCFAVTFVCGDRLLNRMGKMLSIEGELNKLLCTSLAEFPAMVTKRAADAKETANKLKHMSWELAELKAKTLPTDYGLVPYHWDGGDLNLLNKLASNYTGEAVLLLTATHQGMNDGVMVLSAFSTKARAMVDLLAKDDCMREVLEVCEMRGGGGKGRWQGKGLHLEKYEKAGVLLGDAFSRLSA